MGKEQAPYEPQTPSKSGSRHCPPPPGPEQEGSGAKGAGALASLHFKEKLFPEEVEATRDLLVNPFLRNRISDL